MIPLAKPRSGLIQPAVSNRLETGNCRWTDTLCLSLSWVLLQGRWKMSHQTQSDIPLARHSCNTIARDRDTLPGQTHSLLVTPLALKLDATLQMVCLRTECNTVPPCWCRQTPNPPSLSLFLSFVFLFRLSLLVLPTPLRLQFYWAKQLRRMSNPILPPLFPHRQQKEPTVNPTGKLKRGEVEPFIGDL